MTRDTEVREAAKAQKRGNGPGNWGGPIGAKVVAAAAAAPSSGTNS